MTFNRFCLRFIAVFVFTSVIIGCGQGDNGNPAGDPRSSKHFVDSDSVENFIDLHCTEISLPAILRSSGCYRVVTDHLASSPNDAAITALAQYVKIDLNGHTLTGSGRESLAAGIHAIGTERIKIENGEINHFLYGIRIDPSPERNVVEATVREIKVSEGSARGIFVSAAQATIENNHINNLVGFSGWPASHTMGIELMADKCQVEGNHIADYFPEGVGEAVGISLSSGVSGCTVSQNRIESSHPAEFGRTIGMWFASEQKGQDSDALVMRGNVVNGADYAFFSGGTPMIENNTFSVRCDPSEVVTYRDYVEDNNFLTNDDPCQDTSEHLATIADTDPRWQLRLAAALLEGQSIADAESSRCERYAKAKEILNDQSVHGTAGAASQVARVDALWDAHCPTESTPTGDHIDALRFNLAVTIRDQFGTAADGVQ